MRRDLFLFLSCLLSTINFVHSQSYIGAGSTTGVSVTSSSEYADTTFWADTARASNTINGSGMNAAFFEAGRFLTQASLGFEEKHLQDVVDLGIEGWIDAQIADSMTLILPEVELVFDLIKDSLAANGTAPAELERMRPRWNEFNYAWWQVNMTNEDLLRHKVAAALSEIFVISRQSDLSEFGDGMASYYDILLRYAFGDYRDMLYEISLHPCMGFYLTHLNNPKTDTFLNIRPDENYAREIMQLFSIGLYELNIDGSRKVDSMGSEIPTYGQTDIREMAKVFTGLGMGDIHPNMYYDEPEFGMWIGFGDVTVPMRMWDQDDPATMYYDEDEHEDGNKYVLGDTVYANSSGLHEIGQAIDILANHENVGPFLSHLLIQRLVKSNPSPEYISRVAQVFNDNGNGARGDLGAVVKAILLDPEARDCPDPSDPTQNKVKEPLFRWTQFARMAEKSNPQGLLWNINWNFFQNTRQDILASPSVFNFFLPTDAPNGPISDLGLVAPEFKLHNSQSSIGYMNHIWDVTFHRNLMWNWSQFDFGNVRWDTESLEPMTRDPEYYINHLDLMMTHGSLSDEYRDFIRNGVSTFDSHTPWHNAPVNRTTLGMYFILVSPEYSIVK